MATDLAPTHDELEPLEHERWTADEIVAGLTALALNGGNASRAADQLNATGLEISHDTLSRWRNQRFPHRYRDACERLAPQVEDAVINQAREAAVLAAHAEHKLLTRLHDEADQLDLKDLGNTLRNVTTSKGINTDKFLSRPPVVVEHRTIDETLTRLRALGLITDTTAEDIDEPKRLNEGASLPASA